MSFRLRRLLGVSALSLLFGLGVSACSGGQQEDEGMAVTDDQAADGDTANAASNEDGGGGDNQAADENAATNGDGAEKTADGGNGTENDLQEIITEMNGQQTEGGAAGADAGEAQALQQNGAAPAAVPANNTPAPAPVKEAAAAPAQNPLPFQPGGTPAGNGLPEVGSKMAYIVEQGDTLAKISQKIYGTPGRWNEMATLSGITTPSRIYPGDLVYYTLDEGAVNFAKAYDSLQRSEEQVKPGDTMATIAQRVYGNTKGWRSIWRHNDKIDNPDHLTAGTTVYYLPKGAAAAAVKMAKSDTAKLANHKAVKHQKTDKILTKHLKTSNGKVTAKVSKVNGIQLAGSQTQYDLKTKTQTGVRLI